MNKYPASFKAQSDGGFMVRFADFPEAITEGDTREEALFNAQEALSLAIEQRLADNESVPAPSRHGKRAVLVTPDADVQAAMLMRQARAAEGRSLAEVARALNTSWPAAQRLEDPRGNPTLRQLERAAAALGRRLVLEFE